MGDSGEGIVDAESRIQERLEELERERDRERKHRHVPRDPELQRSLESLRLARTELERQLNATPHAGRKTQLRQALEEIDRRMAETSARMAE